MTGVTRIDLWWLTVTSLVVDEASTALLDKAELDRARRFHFEGDRSRFVQRRGFVRRVLAGYLDVTPREVQIRRTVFGRPELEPPTEVSFSLSHADELTVLAVARNCQIGVDIERLRPVGDGLDIAEDMFAEPEVALLRSLPPASRSRAFLELWTRKESVVKAMGSGLSSQLDRFSVVGEDGSWLERPCSRTGDLPLTVGPLVSSAGYIGAVAARAGRIALREKGAEQSG